MFNILLLLQSARSQDCNITDFDHQQLINSGKFINDLGDFDDCLRDPSRKYYSLLIVNNFLGNMYYGACLPSTCTADILNKNYSQPIAKILNESFQKIFNTSSEVVPYVIFFDATNYPGLTPSRLFALVLVLGLLGLCLASSILSGWLGKSKLGQIVRCFSFKDNLSKIMSFKEPENSNLTFINGLRVICMLWVIFGHGNWIRVLSIRNWISTIDILQAPGIPTLVVSAYYAVDVFFWIGGFLLTIGLLDKLDSKRFFSKYIGLIAHRLIRIWPTYIVAILFYWKIMPLMGSGPVFSVASNIVNSCNNGGFLNNLFFIDNFRDHGKNGQDYCFGWGWYLAVDFQLFIITPFIFMAYKKSKKWGTLLVTGMFFASVVCAWLLVFINNWRYPVYNPSMKPQPEFMDKFYYKPYVRVSTYLMGILSGFFYTQWKLNNAQILYVVNRVKNSIRIRALFFLLGIFLICFIVFVTVPYQSGEVQWSTVTQAFYNSYNRVFFVLGVMLLCFPAMFGCKNDPCHIFLGSRFFYPLAKIQFATYLVHLVIVILNAYSLRALSYWQTFPSLIWTGQDAVMSIFFGLVLSMIVQAPILNLQKILMKPKKKQERKEDRREQLLLNESLNPKTGTQLEQL